MLTLGRQRLLLITTICCVSMLLALSGCQLGQDPSAVLEEANLEKALYCMDILENRPDLEPSHRIDILRNECFAETYIQHSPHLQDGRDTVLGLFANRYIKFPETSTTIKRAASEGDLVWIHQHVKRNFKFYINYFLFYNNSPIF